VFTETIFISTHPHYLLTCRPERGRLSADEGPAVRFASFLCLLLYVVIPSEAAFWPTRDLLFVLLVLFLFLFLYVVIPSEAAFWPTRDLLFVLLRSSFCFVSRFASLFGFAGFYPGDRKAEVCPAKSSHVGFVFSISAIFLARLQPLISFSRRIAALMSVKTS
jgi:hypothetical protein